MKTTPAVLKLSNLPLPTIAAFTRFCGFANPHADTSAAATFAHNAASAHAKRAADHAVNCLPRGTSRPAAWIAYRAAAEAARAAQLAELSRLS